MCIFKTIHLLLAITITLQAYVLVHLSFQASLYNTIDWPRLVVVHTLQISSPQRPLGQNLSEPGHEKTCLMSQANNKGEDQPAHPHSLISTFVVRCLDNIIPLVSISKISSL